MKEFLVNYEYYKNQLKDARNIFTCIAKNEIYSDLVDLEVFYSTTDEPIPYNQRLTLSYKPLKVGESWGTLFQSAWFKVKGKIAKEVIPDAILALDINGEALLYDSEGVPLKGFTNGSSVFDRELGEPGKQYYPLEGLVETDGTIELYLDCGCNDLFGNVQENGALKFAKVVTKDEEALEAYYDYEVLLSLAESLEISHPDYMTVFNSVIAIRNLYWYQVKDHIAKAHQIALETFAKIKGESKGVAYMVGHAHLDLAWLWPLRESKRKAVRTLTNVIYLLKRYPDMIFCISQPQQLEWIKENSLELYEQIKEYVKSGRIEIVGGFYVENDTNLTGEESLVREALYGQKFWMKEFGKHSDICFLPDCFGFTASLPQILVKSYQKYFLTIKISWCNNTIFPYHNFKWQGIDGSEVLAHFPLEGTYNSGAYPNSLKKVQDNVFKEDVIPNSVMLYGIGDGAGGPGEEHLERITREKSLSTLPSATLAKVHAIYDDLEKVKDKLATYSGELYLETHQGTYTSQSETKRLLRELEQKIKSLEYVASVTKDDKAAYSLARIYKDMLVYYFHDIIPGTSIRRVYEEAVPYLESLVRKLDKLCNARDMSLSYIEGLETYNTSSGLLTRYHKENDKYTVVETKPFSTKSTIVTKLKTRYINDEVISNDYYKIEFAKEGYIKSLYSKSLKKEMLEGKGNALRVYIDHGDAWNIMDSYREQDEVYMTLVKRTITEYADLFEIISTYSYNDSVVEETMIVPNSDKPIEITHKTLWKDLKRMLRSTFEVAIESNEVVADIQFGNIRRSTKTDTIKERAQFEICAHNYLDISDATNGLAILSKVKNGYYAKGKTLELNLLRSTDHPCKHGDQEPTTYSYAIYPHKACKVGEIDIVANAYVSKPIYLKEELDIEPLVAYDYEALEYSAYKRAYEEEGYILRLYERNGTTINTVINVKEGYEVYETNLVEEEPLPLDINSVTFGPYEIKTLWVKPKKGATN